MNHCTAPGHLRNDISPFAHTARVQTYYGRMAMRLRYMLLTPLPGARDLRDEIEDYAVSPSGALTVRWRESAARAPAQEPGGK